MKAVVFDRFGGPEVLQYRDVPDPATAADEVRIEVKACGINHLDLWVRAGLPGLEPEMPHILGNDVVGVAVEVGEVVRHIKPGDKVLVLPTLSCGACQACHAGDDNLCREHDVLGRARNGGYAEQVCVPARNCLSYPENLPWQEAAAIPLVLLTAWHMLVGRADLRPGEDCLIIGAGSGVGSLGIQVARLLGARVIATAGSDAKLAKAKELGAHDVINHATGDVGREARQLTGKKGVDVLFEHVGGEVFEQAIKGVARDGRVVTCGATLGSKVSFDLNLLFGRHLTVMGSWMGRRAGLIEALKFVRDGRIRPVVDSVLPLEDAQKGHERLESREHFGKIVLIP